MPLCPFTMNPFYMVLVLGVGSMQQHVDELYVCVVAVPEEPHCGSGEVWPSLCPEDPVPWHAI